MQGRFYPDVFARHGITVHIPDPENLAYIHDRYLGELVQGTFLPTTRARLLASVHRLKDTEGIEGLILGGTELPLLQRDAGDTGIPFLDTTRIHVARAMSEILA